MRAWSAAQALEEDHTGEDNHPAVALNATGNGVVAWQRGSALWARIYDATRRTFGPATLVATPSRYDDLQVGIDAQGNVILVWVRDDTTQARGIWWSRTIDSGVSWSAPAPIAIGSFRRCRLAVSANGTALAAWTARASDNIDATVGSSDFRGGTWAPQVNTPLIGTGLGDRNPRVALDGSGRGFLIWEQAASLKGGSNVWTERYDGGWLPHTVAILDSRSADDAYTPTLALNETGSGTALWLEMWNFVPQLFARRFDGQTWGDLDHLATAPLVEWDPPPEIAVDPLGAAVALWSEVSDLALIPQTYHLHGIRHLAGTGPWQPPELIETTNLISSDLTEYTDPLVGMDGDGNALATWRNLLPSGRVQVTSSRRLAGSASWTPANGAPLHDDPMRTVRATDFAVSRNGTALAAWSYGPELDIWVSVFR